MTRCNSLQSQSK